MTTIKKSLLQLTVAKLRHTYVPLRAKHFPAGRRNARFLRPLPITTATISFLVAFDGMGNHFTYTGAAFRFIRSVKTASLIAIDYKLLERHESTEDYDTRCKEVHLKSANRLLDTCLRNGGLYIKVGQGFAAINHILPKEYTETLSLLQNECLPTTKEDVQKVFLTDFKQLPEDIYAEFDYKPVAAASLAQVFKAKLKSGEDVAVKVGGTAPSGDRMLSQNISIHFGSNMKRMQVQYNDLTRRFTSDMGTIIFLQDIIEIIFKDYNFGWIMRDLRNNLVQEMNFVNEGKNAERCAGDLRKFQYVHVPDVFWKYTKTRVLTLEWINGFKIDDLAKIKVHKLDLTEIDIKMFKTFAEQIFNSGFVHADPHPGNIFLRKSAITGNVELVLLDHGLYEVLPEKVRLPLCEFWEATVLHDERRMEAAGRELGIKNYMQFAEVLFQQPIKNYSGQHIRTKLTERDIQHIQELARKNFNLIMDTLKEMPRNMLFIVRNLNTVRAISNKHGDVVDRPRIMARHAQRCLYARNHTIRGYVQWIYKRALFEYYLWSFSFRMTCLNLYFKVLYRLGRAPASATTLLKDLRKAELK